MSRANKIMLFILLIIFVAVIALSLYVNHVNKQMLIRSTPDLAVQNVQPQAANLAPLPQPIFPALPNKQPIQAKTEELEFQPPQAQVPLEHGSEEMGQAGKAPAAGGQASSSSERKSDKMPSPQKIQELNQKGIVLF